MRRLLVQGVRKLRRQLGPGPGGSVPAPEGGAARPRPVRRRFDRNAEAAYLADLDRRAEACRDEIVRTRVSVIMPAFNRERTIGRAVESVLGQTHGNLELLVVDDGSTDGTRGVLEAHARDPRVRLLSRPHLGVGAARNAGLEAAAGGMIAYLDSDNAWKPGYLKHIVSEIAASGLDCAYAATEMRDDLERVVGYRGEPFDRAACLEENYIDLNVFCHRKEVIDEAGGFDTRLRRFVDWDFVLRCTRGRRVRFAPFLGCEYSEAGDVSRVTNSEPFVYFSLVQLMHREGVSGSPPPSIAELAGQLKLRVAIKVPVREGERERCGISRSAAALKAALDGDGHRARLDFLGTWHKRPAREDDVVITIGGPVAYEPRRRHVNVMLCDREGFPGAVQRGFDLVHTVPPGSDAAAAEETDVHARQRRFEALARMIVSDIHRHLGMTADAGGGQQAAAGASASPSR